MNNNILSIYYKDINEYNLLSPEEEQELAARVAEGDIEARNKLVTANLKLVLTQVKYYVGCGLNIEDLIQEGNIGLLKAAEKFDVSLGYRFATYALWWIRQTLSRAIAEQGRIIRVPVYMTEKINKLRSADRKLTVSLGRKPTQDELAAEMQLPVDEIKKISDIILDACSLDVPLSDEEEEGTTLGDLVEDPKVIDPQKEYKYNSNEDILNRVLNTLTSKEATILRQHFGLCGQEPKSLDEIAKELELSKERVRQIEVKALRKLRVPARANYIKKYCGAA